MPVVRRNETSTATPTQMPGCNRMDTPFPDAVIQPVRLLLVKTILGDFLKVIQFTDPIVVVG
jgi:hypothetical protein